MTQQDTASITQQDILVSLDKILPVSLNKTYWYHSTRHTGIPQQDILVSLNKTYWYHSTRHCQYHSTRHTGITQQDTASITQQDTASITQQDTASIIQQDILVSLNKTYWYPSTRHTGIP